MPYALPTELRGQVGSSMWYFRTESSSIDINVMIWLLDYIDIHGTRLSST
jgi:hypothetical protein